MTKFLDDVLRQPKELQKVFDTLLSPTGRELIDEVTAKLRGCSHIYLTGIGASWNAAAGGHAIFHAGGLPVSLLDASELLLNCTIAPGSSLLIVSRSGQSIEIVNLLEKARAAGATVIAITSFVEGALAREADLTVLVPVEPDGGISVNTYTGLAAAIAVVASATAGTLSDSVLSNIRGSIDEAARRIPGWQQQLEGSSWFQSGAAFYFLARGSSLATAHEAALLWHEGLKIPAVVMGTDSFRHGPQEVVTASTRFAIWVDPSVPGRDLAIARDLRIVGASVFLVGTSLPPQSADLQIEIPPTPPFWEFVLDAIPIQLAIDIFARLVGVDCDSFRFASYIVSNEQGILPTSNAAL